MHIHRPFHHHRAPVRRRCPHALGGGGARVRIRRTDYGTIILHWLLAGATVVAFITGLRIATEAPDHAWLNNIDWLLPRAHVWTWHMPAAVVLVGVAVAYMIY